MRQQSLALSQTSVDVPQWSVLSDRVRELGQEILAKIKVQEQLVHHFAYHVVLVFVVCWLICSLKVWCVVIKLIGLCQMGGSSP